MKVNKEVLDYALATFCLKGISLMMLPVVTHFLPPAEYGLLNFLVSLVAMLSIVLSFGFAEVLFRFTPEMPETKIQGFINGCLKLCAVISFLFFSISMFCLDYIVAILPVRVDHLHLVLLFFNLSLNLIVGIFLTAYRLQNKSRKYLIIALSQGILQAALTFLFLILGWSVTGVLLSGAIAAAVVTIVLLLRHKEVWLQKTEKITLVHVKYGIFITISGLFLYGLGGAENWFIAGMLGPERLTSYFIASQFVLALSLMFEPFRLWWFPKRFEHYFLSPKSVAQGAEIGCVVFCLMTLAMMLLGPVVIKVLLPNVYSISAQYLPILCVVLVIKTFAELLNLGCYLDKTAKYVPLINGFTAFIAMLLFALGIEYFGIFGVFGTLLIVHTARFIMFYFKSQQIAELPYDSKVLLISFSMIIVQFVLVYISFWLALCWFVMCLLVSLLFYKTRYCSISFNKQSDSYELS